MSKKQTPLLAAASLGCTLILLIRQLSGHPEFVSMHWNLFLAWTPLFLNLAIHWVYQKTKTSANPVVVGLLFVWLIFYPNAPYLVTDLVFHDLLWIDRVIFSVYAFVGVWIAILSLQMVVKIIEEEKRNACFFVIVVTILTGFALHLGHYQRWNSWDVFIQPIPLLIDAWQQIPASLPIVATYSFFFSFLWNFYQNESKALNDP